MKRKRNNTQTGARPAQPFEQSQAKFGAAVKRLSKQPLVVVRERLLVALTALIGAPRRRAGIRPDLHRIRRPTGRQDRGARSHSDRSLHRTGRSGGDAHTAS